MLEIKNKNCYVAFLDILGFKELVKTKEKYEDVVNLYSQIENAKQYIVAEIQDKNFEYMLLSSNTVIRIMSDSIVIAIPSELEGSFDFICRCCVFLQRKLGKIRIFLRGGIASGEFTCYEDVIFGQGLIDAYILESKVAKYPRVLISLNIEIDKYNSDKYDKLIEFDKNENLYFLNFMKAGEAESYIKHFEEMIKIYEADLNIKGKYVWLLNHANEIGSVGEDYGKNKKET